MTMICTTCGCETNKEREFLLRDGSHRDLRDCIDAVTARAEAAEAENERLTAENRQLTARVAELEAARRFKRGYPDKPGMYIVRRADGTVGTARYYTDGWNWGAFNTDITRWAEMPEEPTP